MGEIESVNVNDNCDRILFFSCSCANNCRLLLVMLNPLLGIKSLSIGVNVNAWGGMAYVTKEAKCVLSRRQFFFLAR